MDLPFIIIAPQCFTGIWRDSTNVENLYRLINEVLGIYRIDPKKVNLTSFSMGGDGTWALAIRHPELFSAIAPVSGFGYSDESVVSNLINTPTWVFHGENDEFVPIDNARRMIQFLQNHNGKATLTIWPEQAIPAHAQ